MPKYFGLLLSPNMEKTPEGYLICKNVPICRSGYQEYLGKELDGFPGYRASWDLIPDSIYRVFRPKDEVLHPDFIASLEGKTVVNEHPKSEGNVVDVDNDRDLTCGHIERVKEGPMLDGEVTLQGDLIIKDPLLIDKIKPDCGDDDDAVRDVSCGYTLKLKRLPDGMLIMYNLRGNHVAVVEKGRAGSRIAIKDSAPPEVTRKKEKTMSLRELIFGHGLKAYMADATPEELASVVKEMDKEDKPKTETDEEPKKKPAVDEKTTTDPHRDAAHACVDRALDAAQSDDNMGVDAFGKPTHLDEIKKELLRFLGGEPAATDSIEELEKPTTDEDPEEEKKEAAGDSDTDEDSPPIVDADGVKKEVDDPGESVLKAATDSVRNFIRNTKPVVAAIAAKPRSKRTPVEQTMVDSYNKAVRDVNSTKGKVYSNLAKVKVPTGIATDSVTQKVETCTCFDGVPYLTGKKLHEAHIAQKGSK
jgi:hypothetical protein